ncbi:hypothetical protein MFRU_015g01520 [Monilinia fructicola]|nr:hypothetical protein MFRU_015g01520 [Monilinia fructicola]
MRFQYLHFSTLLGLAASAPLSTYGTSSSKSSPCGLITSQLEEYLKTSGSNSTVLFYFDSELANECLLSSVIDNDLAASFVVEYKKYVQFQSTLNYLKYPTDGYCSKRRFSSQYAFDQALALLLTSAHEGHLYTSFCTSLSISYQRGIDLISLSSDGIKLPKIYVLDDVQSASNSIVDISNIVTINEKDASEYIRELAIVQPSLAISSVVSEPPTAGTPFGAFSFTNLNNYPGAFTNLTFANGTIASSNTAGVSPERWSTNIVDGESFTNHFCIDPAQADFTPTATASAAPSSTSSTTAATSTTSAPYLLGHVYNEVVKDPNNQVAGYFLNGSYYEDTAVLYVASFANELFGNENTNPLTFQNTTQTFFNAGRAANKTKLVIDLSGNGGGNTILPNDLFRRLFPTIESYGGGRVRVGDAADIYGKTIAAVPDDVLLPNTSDNETVIGIKSVINRAPWNYRSSLDSG